MRIPAKNEFTVTFGPTGLAVFQFFDDFVIFTSRQFQFGSASVGLVGTGIRH